MNDIKCDLSIISSAMLRNLYKYLLKRIWVSYTNICIKATKGVVYSGVDMSVNRHTSLDQFDEILFIHTYRLMKDQHLAFKPEWTWRSTGHMKGNLELPIRLYWCSCCVIIIVRSSFVLFHSDFDSEIFQMTIGFNLDLMASTDARLLSIDRSDTRQKWRSKTCRKW